MPSCLSVLGWVTRQRLGVGQEETLTLKAGGAFSCSLTCNRACKSFSVQPVFLLSLFPNLTYL